MSDPNEGRLGYKETKVGWIPEHWDVRRLDTLADRQTGHTPDKDVPEYWNGGRAWLSLADSDRLNKVWIDETAKEISDQGLENSSARLLPPGTVVLLRDASVGRVGVLRVEMAVSQHFVAWVCSHELNNLFLYYWLLSQGTLFKRQAVGTTIVTIGMQFFARLAVPVPPIREQEAIAEILHLSDVAIRKTTHLIEAHKSQRAGVVQQLLDKKKRIAGFSNAWSARRLGDLFTERRETNATDLQLLAITGTRGIIPADEVERRDSSRADKSNYKVIRRGDIGYNTMRMWQGVSAVSRLDGIVSPAYTVCTPSEKVDAEFMALFLKHAPTVHRLWQYSQGLVSDTLNLKFKNFAEVPVLVPGRSEQQAIAEVARTADTRLTVLTRRLGTYGQRSRALMQKLLTGQVSVKV